MNVRRPNAKLFLAGYLIFSVSGLFALAKGGLWLKQWRDAKSWIGVPCNVPNVFLERGVGGTAEDFTSVPFRIRCNYTYEWRGILHSASRVSITEQTGNDAPYFDLYHNLVSVARDGLTTTCFVNPRDPSVSVLTRQFESRMILVPTAGLMFLVAPNLFLMLWMYGRKWMIAE